MAMNPYVGWGLTTLMLYFLNKRKNLDSESQKPSTLSTSVQQTRMGTPIPVVFGQTLLKSPLVVYYGDFRADRYTETYAAHAKFNAWPIILSTLINAILMYNSKPYHGTGAAAGDSHRHSNGNNGSPTGGPIVPVRVKDPELAFWQQTLWMMLFNFLLSWLINGRNLKTTMQKGFKYYLGYQYLLCWSNPAMRLKSIYLNQNKVWEGDVWAGDYLDQPFSISVNEPDLFGGVDEQGGFIGEIRVYFGSENQPADPWMVGQMQADSVQKELRGKTPAYRPFVSIVVPTAYIGKQANIPEMWVELQNCPNNLGFEPVGQDCNPMELIYALHTDEGWGIGESRGYLDLDSMLKAGEMLQEEQLGISGIIATTTQASNVIDDICEHVNCVRYLAPDSGKLVFLLIRNDYDVEEAFYLSSENCTSIEFTRLDWIETVNQVIVSYTARSSLYEEATVSDNDPANYDITGTRTSQTVDYRYFTQPASALWAVHRELNERAYPIANVSITGNRNLSACRIGEVVVLTWEPYGIKNMILRITDVDIGDYLDGVVRLEAMEDVFGLEKTEYDFSSGSGWNPQPLFPDGVQYYDFYEFCWEMTREFNTFVYAFAAQPSPVTSKWTVWRQPLGIAFHTTTSLTNWTPTGRLVYNITEFSAVEDVDGFEIIDVGGNLEDFATDLDVDYTKARRGGNIVFIGNEILSYSNLVQLPNGNWRVRGILRGIYDTVPQPHFEGDSVYFVKSGFYSNVVTGGYVCAAGETTAEQYNITTETVDNKEDFNYQKIKGLTTVRRAERPNVPGRFRMSWHARDRAVYVPPSAKVSGDVRIFWVPRNKEQQFGCLSQDDEYEYWSGGEFAPPDNSDYVLRVQVGTQVAEHTIDSYEYIYDDYDQLLEKNLITDFTYTWQQRCNDFPLDFTNNTTIGLYSRKNGLVSYQAHERTFQWTIPYVVDVVETVQEGLDKLLEWGISDRIVIPDGPVSTQKIILYEDCPIIVTGEKVSSFNENDTLVSHDGSYWKPGPGGVILLATGEGTYEQYHMQNGYLFGTYYTQTGAGGNLHYDWYDGGVRRRVLI